jgi:hypothetical protein
MIVRVPGTGGCPADSTDPESLPRLWETLTTWMRKQGVFDVGGLCIWMANRTNEHYLGTLVLPVPVDPGTIDLACDVETAPSPHKNTVLIAYGRSSRLNPVQYTYNPETKAVFVRLEPAIGQILHA